MKQGKLRFEFQLGKIELLFAQAVLQENTALWLFLHDLRTPVFMLEGLSKLYAGLHNKKMFTKLKEQFKTIEDSLGSIDYYAAFAKEFAANEGIPAAIKNFLDSRTKQEIEKLNVLLKEDKWLNGTSLTKIREKLKKADWIDEEKETPLFKKFYIDQIKKIQEFVTATDFVFDNVEEDVHELRRKMRWLSIYPGALRGAIQLKETKPAADHLVKYLTPQIISSPYNQFPASGNLSSVLLLEKNCFLALSWMIAELGKIKDDGLRIKVLKDSLQETALLNDTASLSEVYKLLGETYPHMETLLTKAGEICKEFFKEKNLDTLLKLNGRAISTDPENTVKQK
jgi:hypothetical protein